MNGASLFEGVRAIYSLWEKDFARWAIPKISCSLGISQKLSRGKFVEQV
jgi:hypothetical protein